MDVDNPKRAFAIDVVRKLRAGGFDALWAGGCVRDLLMQREPVDYDVATNATPDQVRDLFGHRRTLAVGESFGVVIVLGPKGPDRPQIEVATFRTEGPYLDGRHPQSVQFATAEQDAQRRDFTINGMFYDPVAERVLDYVGGEADLQVGILRAIGSPHARMTEDKLRMLRAVRFAAGLDFELDPATADAIRSLAPEIVVVSRERIAQELRRMLVHRHRRRAMRLCNELELLTPMLPELAASFVKEPSRWHHALDMLDVLDDPSFELAAAVLLQSLPAGTNSRQKGDDPGSARAVCHSWKLSTRETDAITWLVGHQSALSHPQTLPLSRLKRLLASPHADDLLKFLRADVTAGRRDPTDIDFLESFVATTPREEIDPPEWLTGDDLIRMGGRPGPAFKSLLEQVRDAQLEGRIASRDEALSLAKTLLESAS